MRYLLLNSKEAHAAMASQSPPGSPPGRSDEISFEDPIAASTPKSAADSSSTEPVLEFHIPSFLQLSQFSDFSQEDPPLLDQSFDKPKSFDMSVISNLNDTLSTFDVPANVHPELNATRRGSNIDDIHKKNRRLNSNQNLQPTPPKTRSEKSELIADGNLAWYRRVRYTDPTPPRRSAVESTSYDDNSFYKPIGSFSEPFPEIQYFLENEGETSYQIGVHIGESEYAINIQKNTDGGSRFAQIYIGLRPEKNNVLKKENAFIECDLVKENGKYSIYIVNFFFIGGVEKKKQFQAYQIRKLYTLKKTEIEQFDSGKLNIEDVITKIKDRYKISRETILKNIDVKRNFPRMGQLGMYLIGIAQEATDSKFIFAVDDWYGYTRNLSRHERSTKCTKLMRS